MLKKNPTGGCQEIDSPKQGQIRLTWVISAPDVFIKKDG
jgi:hypothetical protein